MEIEEKLPQPSSAVDYQQLASQIKAWGTALGFQQVGISDCQLDSASVHLKQWLQAGYHGEMTYMARNIEKRCSPAELLPGTLRVISLRMDYLPANSALSEALLATPERAFISRYALGRDYHKVLRQRLKQLAQQITEQVGPFIYRPFVDSAPVLEKALAQKAGLGWIGKHSNLLNRTAGSWFFLGELYTNLPLPIDSATSAHCGSCTACIDICPTQAIVAPYRVDARRCIAYLTIELRGSIPIELRPLIGNRIYGCDDCQLVCPWNRFAKTGGEAEFQPRHTLDNITLLALFAWNETEFLQRLEGSPIRRIGHQQWLRNIAVALGNGPKSPQVISALQARLDSASPMLREHLQWALSTKG